MNNNNKACKPETVYKEALKKAINRNFWNNWAIQAEKEYQRLKKQKRREVS